MLTHKSARQQEIMDLCEMHSGCVLEEKPNACAYIKCGRLCACIVLYVYRDGLLVQRFPFLNVCHTHAMMD